MKFKPYSLEDLGITQEEYEYAQNRVRKIESVKIEERCEHFWAVYLGDCNDNGKLSIVDAVAFQNALLDDDHSICTEYEFGQFGLISVLWNYVGYNPTTFDLWVAHRIILGLEVCK